VAKDDFDRAKRLIAQIPGRYRFHGGKNERVVGRAQELLHLPFPESYKLFLREFGCGFIGVHELYGLVDDNAGAVGVPNVVWVTLEERKFGLPNTYAVIEASGDGALYCLDTVQISDQMECPVVIHLPGYQSIPERLAEDFGSYLLGCAHETLLNAADNRGRQS
jgi:hypothetical protein